MGALVTASDDGECQTVGCGERERKWHRWMDTRMGSGWGIQPGWDDDRHHLLGRSAKVWDGRAEAELASLDGHTNVEVNSAFSPDGR